MIRCFSARARTGHLHLFGSVFCRLRGFHWWAFFVSGVGGLNAERADGSRAGASLHPLLRPAAAFFVAGP